LKFACSQEDKINEFDELLKAVRTAAYKTDGQVKTLWDDISFHYSNESYPLVYEIENLMRRLIFQFLLTNVGEDWEKDALPKDLKDGVKKRGRKRCNEYLARNRLYSTRRLPVQAISN